MLRYVGLSVDEIVFSRDAAFVYAYIHLQRKVRERELEICMETLATSHSVKSSNLFRYEPIASNIPNMSEHIEDHPGFKTLVHHEANHNENFYRWTAHGYSGVNCGYNLLKARLLAGSTSSPVIDTSTRGTRGRASSGEGGMGGETPDDGGEEEESMPHPQTPRTNNERGKRQRTGSPGGTSRNLVPLDIMMDKMAATISSAVTAAISSSGSDRNAEREGARTSIQQEQRRREQAENEVRALQMDTDRKMAEERRRIEVEMGSKYEKELERKASVYPLIQLHICMTCWLCLQEAEFKSKWTDNMQAMFLSHENAVALKTQELAAEVSTHTTTNKELGEARMLLQSKVKY